MSYRLFFLLALVLAPPAWAEWRIGPGSEIFAGTLSAFGLSDEGLHALGISCRGDEPFLWTQGFAAKPGADKEESFQVSVDGQAYPVTGTHSPPDGLWTGLPGDRLVASLRAGNAATVSPPGETPVRVPLTGSSRRIEEVLASCESGQDPGASTIRGAVLGPGLDTTLAEACGGPYNLQDGAVLSGLIDDDDRPDTVLYWGGVTCDDRSKGLGAGFCGMALCRIDIDLTQTGEVQKILGLGARLVDRGFGRAALRTETQGQVCGGAAQTCHVNWRWTNQELEAGP